LIDDALSTASLRDPGGDPEPEWRCSTLAMPRAGSIMLPISLCLLLGPKTAGKSTLLAGLRQRADLPPILVIDQAVAWSVQPDRGAVPLALPPRPDWGELAQPEDFLAWLRWLLAGPAGAPAPARILLASDLPQAPRHLLRALAADAELAARFRLDGVTLCIDAATGEAALAAEPALRRQAALADRIVLTKTDLAAPARLRALAGRLKALNPPAPILRARQGDIGPARLIDSGLFDPLTGSVDIDRWLCEAAYGFEAGRRGVLAARAGRSRLLERMAGTSEFRSFALTLDTPISSTALAVFLKLLMAEDARLLRLKGIVAVAERPDLPAILDGTEQVVQRPLWLAGWPTADRRTRLVLVTSDLPDRWVAGLLATLDGQLQPSRAAV
jgi:G3E family GTPase